MVNTTPNRLMPRLAIVGLVGALVILAAQPAASHGEGGIPAQLDLMRTEAKTHDAVTATAHNGLAVDHDGQDAALSGLAVDHDVQDAAHAGLGADHDVQDGAHAALGDDHDLQDIAHASLATDVDDLQARVARLQEILSALDVAVESSPGAAGAGLAPQPPNEAFLLVRVSFAGAGVSGIPESGFTLATRIVPAGECALEIDTFTDFGGGDYGLGVTPVDSSASCDWEAGDYLSSVLVQSGGSSGSALSRLSIPGAETSTGSSAGTGTAWWVPTV